MSNVVKRRKTMPPVLADDEMVDRGAARIWEMYSPVGAIPTPWDKVHRWTKQQLRHEVREIFKAVFNHKTESGK